MDEDVQAIIERNIDVPKDAIAAFCERHHIRKLSFFGSVLTEDFGPESDIDVLVEFEEGHTPDFLAFVDMEAELAEILGREIDFNTSGFLSPHFRDEVVKMAERQYERRRQIAAA
jgi:hypothetical protein